MTDKNKEVKEDPPKEEKKAFVPPELFNPKTGRSVAFNKNINVNSTANNTEPAAQIQVSNTSNNTAPVAAVQATQAKASTPENNSTNNSAAALPQKQDVPKFEAKIEAKVDAQKIDTKLEIKVDQKPEVKPEPKKEVKPEVKKPAPPAEPVISKAQFQEKFDKNAKDIQEKLASEMKTFNSKMNFIKEKYQKDLANLES